MSIAIQLESRRGCISRAKLLVLLLALGHIPGVASAQTGTVSGTVTNTATGGPAAGGLVRFCTASQTCTNSAVVPAGGTYSVNLAAGTYFAMTVNFQTQGLVNEIYDNVTCVGGCSEITAVTTGTPIVVAAGATVTGRDFALAPGGSVAGTVTDAATGTPLAGVTVSIRTLIGNSNALVGSATSGASGGYVVQGLATGTYFASTTNSQGYVNEIFNDILCVGTCNSGLVVNSGTGIAVTAGTSTGNVNFGLIAGGRITGTVTNQVSALPMAGVLVQVLTRVGTAMTFVTTAITNASGVYSAAGLPTGSYYLQTSTAAAVNETYNNRPCNRTCTTAEAGLGEPVPVSFGSTTSARDFQLNPGASISGTVRDAGSNATLGLRIGVQAFAQTGATVAPLATTGTDASGNYTLGGLPAGTYYLAAYDLIENAPGYQEELLGGVHCPYCEGAELLSATPVTVAANAVSTGRDFALDPAGRVTGTVTDASTGAPMGGVLVSTFMSGISHPVGEALTNAAGVYSVGTLPVGAVFLATSRAPGHVNEAYNDVPCPSGVCSAAVAVGSGTAVNTVASNTTANVNFALAPRSEAPGPPSAFVANAAGFTVQMSWAVPTSGGAATSYVVEAGLAPGTTAVSLPVVSASFSVPGVGPGTYYLRVRGVNQFGTGAASTEVALTVEASGTSTLGAPQSFVAAIAGGRLTATWSAPSTGPAPAGYLLEAGTASGLSDIAVIPTTARSFVFEPVPPGFYFLRVRATLGASVGPTAAEVMINVGDVPAPPGPPGLSHVVAGSLVTFTFTPPSLGIPTSYVLEAGTAPGLSNITVLDTGSTAPTLAVPGVPTGTYYVRLRSRNAAGLSTPSNERTVIVP